MEQSSWVLIRFQQGWKFNKRTRNQCKIIENAHELDVSKEISDADAITGSCQGTVEQTFLLKAFECYYEVKLQWRILLMGINNSQGKTDYWPKLGTILSDKFLPRLKILAANIVPSLGSSIFSLGGNLAAKAWYTIKTRPRLVLYWQPNEFLMSEKFSLDILFSW